MSAGFRLAHHASGSAPEAGCRQEVSASPGIQSIAARMVCASSAMWRCRSATASGSSSTSTPRSSPRSALPILLGWSPYGKHNLSDRLPWPAADVASGWISRHTAFEAPDPLYWCRNGYAVVYPDPRGSWYSEGELGMEGSGRLRTATT